MSQQLNFFAARQDEPLIFEAILAVFQDGVSTIPQRGDPDEMRLRPIVTPCDFGVPSVSNIAYLIPTSAISAFKLRNIGDGKQVADPWASPILEYHPSQTIAPSTLRVGRIAYFCRDEHPVKKQVGQLFRKLKKSARPVACFPGSWIFAHAAHEAEFLLDWGTVPRPNSLKNVISDPFKSKT